MSSFSLAGIAGTSAGVLHGGLLNATIPGRNDKPTASMRFPRSEHLLRRADFERVYKQGRRHFAAHMTFFYLKSPQGTGARVGFTVGRALGGAVDRNRMKRRLREAVRLQRFTTGLGADVVINPKKTLLTAEFASLKDEVARAGEVIRRKLTDDAAKQKGSSS